MVTPFKGAEKEINRYKKQTFFSKYGQLYIILLPTVLFYAIFHYAPMFGIAVAFQNYRPTIGMFGSDWVGFDNFVRFLSDYSFWRLIRNTLMINVYGLVFGFPAPIIFALLLNEMRNNKIKKIVQTVTYMPHFISIIVISSLILTFVASDGVVNTVAKFFGASEPISFMTKPEYFWGINEITNIWQSLGWNSIIFMAALAGVDAQLYEAAQIDGAGRFKQLWHVTIPCIMGTIIILLILRIGQMMNVGFEKILLLQNPSIYETADVISTHVYRQAFVSGGSDAFSYSTAVGLFNSVVNFILLLSANFLAKKATGSGLW